MRREFKSFVQNFVHEFADVEAGTSCNLNGDATAGCLDLQRFCWLESGGSCLINGTGAMPPFKNPCGTILSPDNNAPSSFASPHCFPTGFALTLATQTTYPPHPPPPPRQFHPPQPYHGT